MRISPIGYSQIRTTIIAKERKSVHDVPTGTQDVNFKGWKAGLGGMVGAGLGLAVGTALSGGLLAPLILAEVGTLGGCIYGCSKEKPESD